MKKLLLSTITCLSLAVSSYGQEIKPCGTYEAREIYLKTVPGYASKLNSAEAAARVEYQTYLQNLKTAKTSSVQPIYTVPVVFHVLHNGEAIGSGTNVSDALLIAALDQVNKDYAKQGSDTSSIDPLFKPLYKNANMKFVLAKKDPKGNCTSGIVRHNDKNSNWSQADVLSFKYSTMAAGNWNPTKYLNIYIVGDIIGPASGTIVGYTFLPGTAPVSAADAIVYRYNYLSGLDARSLSHEIGHWFGLSHTFGSSNTPGFECGNDDIDDTPATIGFQTKCPKPATYTVPPTVTVPLDSSDITNVSFGKMSNTTPLNSLKGKMGRNLLTLLSTTVSSSTDTIIRNASGTPGGYSDFTNIYGNDFNGGQNHSISITSLAKSTDNNYVAVYMDYNSDGDFIDAGESVFNPTVVVNNYSVTPIANAFGPRTFGTPLKINKTYTVATGPGTIVTTYTTTPDSFAIAPAAYVIPAGTYGLIRMRVITSNAPITDPDMPITSGEIEEYNMNIGTTPTAASVTPNITMASCDTIRPNIENIMDYSSCPKMFTIKQIEKMRLTCSSSIASRDSLVGIANLIFTGILDANGNPTGSTSCAPIAEFSSNKTQNCSGQAVLFSDISYNSIPTSLLWTFEGGTPSTSTLSAPSVTYSTIGTYSVSLTASNANGSSTKTVNSYVTVNWNGAKKLPFSEGFESGQWWPDGFVMTNEDLGTPSWEMSNYGASGSSKSVVLASANYLNNFSNFAGNIDIMETPTFDFTNTTGITFSFAYSFARKSTVVATDETFKLQYSLDCGGTWINMSGTPSASLMANSGGVVNAPYIPWSSTTPNPKWITKSYSPAVLASLNNKRDVRFRFWFENDIKGGQSQNLYIDNINISGTVGINEFENTLGLSIYPNPTSSSAVVEFTSPSDTKVNILVYDVTGRVVEENASNTSAGVTSKYTVNASNKLNSGIYFITLIIDNNKITKKLIIE